MTPQNIQEVIKAVQNDISNHLGDVLFPRFRNATTPYASLLAKAQQVGFPEEYLPQGLDPEQAWQYCCRRTTKLDDYLLRAVSKTADEIVWAVVRENKDKANKVLSYTQISNMTLNRHTGTVSAEHPEHPVVGAVLVNHAQMVGSVTTDQIRKMVQDVAQKLSGVPMGTCWFLPAVHGAITRAMKAMVEGLGASEMGLLPIYDSQESRQGISDAVRADLQDEINACKEEIANFTQDSTRIGTLERRLAKFDELRNRAKLYSAMVEVIHDDLDQEISKLEASVAEMIGVKKNTK